MAQAFDRDELENLALTYRYITTDIICRSGSGHIGGALSLVEILITLYKRILKIDPQNPRWKDRDRLVLSKGHAGPILYTVLAHEGFFPVSWLPTLNANGTRLPSHCDQIQTPGIDQTTGSLGQGLSAACGIALAARMNRRDYRTVCIIGDGESNEGQNWEAALFAAHHGLDNLVAITDYNKLQIDGYTHDVLDLEPLTDKWRAFGWEVFEMNGHDWDEIFDTVNQALAVIGKPAMIVAHTTKAQGHALLANDAGSHNIKVPDRESHDQHLGALGKSCPLPY